MKNLVLLINNYWKQQTENNETQKMFFYWLKTVTSSSRFCINITHLHESETLITVMSELFFLWRFFTRPRNYYIDNKALLKERPLSRTIFNVKCVKMTPVILCLRVCVFFVFFLLNLLWAPAKLPSHVGYCSEAYGIKCEHIFTLVQKCQFWLRKNLLQCMPRAKCFWICYFPQDILCLISQTGVYHWLTTHSPT